MKKSLTKAEILRNRREIAHVFRNSAIHRTGGLHLRVRPAPNAASSRVLFATTRGFRTAVARNRTRRYVREAFRLIKHELLTPNDIVFVMYPGDYSAHDRSEQVRRLLERAALVHRR